MKVVELRPRPRTPPPSTKAVDELLREFPAIDGETYSATIVRRLLELAYLRGQVDATRDHLAIRTGAPS